MSITYWGHSCFLIQWNNTKILIDPFIKDNPLASHIDLSTITCDYVLLTHGHSDHVADAAYFAHKDKAPIVSNYEITSWYIEKGHTGVYLNHGGKYTLNGITIKYVTAIHSSVLPDGSYGGNPGGFVIWEDQKCIYIAGDTALTLDMKLIPMTCPKLDLAILPIGDHFTMGVDDAIIASDFIACDQIIGCHFDTFGYIKINHDWAVQQFSDKGKNLTIPTIGQQYTL